MKWIHLCGAACIASLLPSGAIADLIFDQSIDLTDGAFPSDFAQGTQLGSVPIKGIPSEVEW